MPREADSVAVLAISDRAEVWGGIVACVGSSPGIHLIGLLPWISSVRQIEAAHADVVLLDCGRNEADVMERLRCLRAGLPAFRFVLIADKIERRFLFEAVNHGARGFFVRPLCGRELLPVLALVASGGFCLCPQAARVLVGSQPERLSLLLPQHVPLTPREVEVLRLQAEGLAYKQIAARLHVSEHTVNNHLYSVRQKLGVHTAIEAISRVLGR